MSNAASISKKASREAASSLLRDLDTSAWTHYPVLNGPDRSQQHVAVGRGVVVVVTFPADGFDETALVAVSGREDWVSTVLSLIPSPSPLNELLDGLGIDQGADINAYLDQIERALEIGDLSPQEQALLEAERDRALSSWLQGLDEQED